MINATELSNGNVIYEFVRVDEKMDPISGYVYMVYTSDTPFTDVKSSTWYVEAVKYAYEAGIMGGVSKNEFVPNKNMTRAELVTVLWRLEGSPEVGGRVPFTDLKQAWYKPAVLWAYRNNIVGGTSETRFSPNGAVTREQMATILFRYSEFMGYGTEKIADIGSFPDVSKVHDWAKSALSWAVAEGLVGGVAKNGKSYLDPRGSATRAQVATILQRFCEKH